jgi:hypothetical protein
MRGEEREDRWRWGVCQSDEAGFSAVGVRTLRVRSQLGSKLGMCFEKSGA